jgi:hypothetical protein
MWPMDLWFESANKMAPYVHRPAFRGASAPRRTKKSAAARFIKS